MTPQALIELLESLHPLWELPRTGWLLRGIRPCESIAEHSFGVALAAMALTDALRAEGATLDGERVLRMALLHDSAEARTGDVPMPVKSAGVKEALRVAEAELVDAMLPSPYSALVHEVADGETIEARVVKAADKIQMMARATAYESQGRGDLSEFWTNPQNFNDRDLGFARRVFELIAERAGRTVPV